MKLSNLWNEKPVTLSFEAFPPKKDVDFDTVRFAIEQIAELGDVVAFEEVEEENEETE